MTQLQAIHAAIMRCEGKKALQLLNQFWWREFFRAMQHEKVMEVRRQQE